MHLCEASGARGPSSVQQQLTGCSPSCPPPRPPPHYGYCSPSPLLPPCRPTLRGSLPTQTGLFGPGGEQLTAPTTAPPSMCGRETHCSGTALGEGSSQGGPLRREAGSSHWYHALVSRTSSRAIWATFIREPGWGAVIAPCNVGGPPPLPSSSCSLHVWRRELGGAPRPLPPPPGSRQSPEPHLSSKALCPGEVGRGTGSAVHSAPGGWWLLPLWASVSPSASPRGASSAKNPTTPTRPPPWATQNNWGPPRPPLTLHAQGLLTCTQSVGWPTPFAPRRGACPPQLLSRDPNPSSVNGFSSAKLGLPSWPPSIPCPWD